MKKKLTKEERKLKRFEKDYESIKAELQLDELDNTEKIHKLVYAASAIQGEICQCSDYIKKDKFNEVKEITQIDGSTWLDFVRIAALKDVTGLQEKAIDKFTEDFEKRLIITNLRKTFLDSYMSNEDLKITDEDNSNYIPFDAYKSDEFATIMEDAAQKRIYINTVLRPRYKVMSNAAQYITNLNLDAKTFKELVDWEHYKDGGYPSPSSPSKIWKIFEQYDHCIRVMKKYGFDVEVDNLHKEFGLNTNLCTPNPIDHPWMDVNAE
jgi:hypothetical protein